MCLCWGRGEDDETMKSWMRRAKTHEHSRLLCVSASGDKKHICREGMMELDGKEAWENKHWRGRESGGAWEEPTAVISLPGRLTESKAVGGGGSSSSPSPADTHLYRPPQQVSRAG